MKKYLLLLLLLVPLTTQAQSYIATATWSASSTTGLFGYNVYKALCLDAVVSHSCTPGTYNLITTTSPSTLTYVDNGTLTPGNGYIYAISAQCPVSGCGTTVIGESTFTTGYAVSIPSLTVTTSLAGAGTGTITSSPAGISCPSTCSTTTFTRGTTVTLTATPTGSDLFQGWSGLCTGTSTCVLTLSTAGTYNAVANFITPTNPAVVNVTNVGNGTVTSSPAGINCGATCSASFTVGTPVTLTAAAGSGFTFTPGWSGSGCSGTSTCVLPVVAPGSFNVTATYTVNTPPSDPVISVNINGNGTVTSSPAGMNCGSTCAVSFTPSSTVTLTATPGTGFSFTGWTNGCTGVSTCVVVLGSTGTVSRTATFTANVPSVFTLATVSTGNGTGVMTSSPAGINCGSTCSFNFDNNTSLTLTAAQNSGSQFVKWSGCSSSYQRIITLTMNQNQTCTATWRRSTKYHAKQPPH